tara:strand:+ start:326 stop:775 length:450 start_codon:yes stop_codon:yes gene_type:complete
LQIFLIKITIKLNNMKKPKDKRTKKYKEWKKKFDNKSKGLGDDIEKITEATGIKQAVKWALGEDCGCDERKEKLNKLFDYSKPECLTESEYIFLDNMFNTKGSVLSADKVSRSINIYNRVFNAHQRATGCSSCFVSNVYNPLKRLYENY